MKKVILIDDEIWALKDLTRMIERRPGWRVTGQFTDSSEALDAILASPPDLVMTDLRMSGLSGREVINALHKKSPGTRVVIISAYSDFGVAREALSRNVIDYLLKPVSQEELFALLHRLEGQTEPYDISVLIEDEGEFTKAAAVYSFNAVLVCGYAWDGRQWLDKLTETLGNAAQLTLLKSDDSLAALVSIQEQPTDEQVASLAALDTGMSRFHESFDDLGAMLQEARISRAAGFTYVKNRLAASVQSYLALNYDRPITLEAVASHLFVAKGHLCNVFSAATGTTIVRFLYAIRIAMAKRLLAETSLSITEIGEKVGYTDSAYFSRVFKRAVSQSPESYRRKMARRRPG